MSDKSMMWWHSLSIYEQRVYAKRAGIPDYHFSLSPSLMSYPQDIETMYLALDKDVREFYRKRQQIVMRDLKEFNSN